MIHGDLVGPGHGLASSFISTLYLSGLMAIERGRSYKLVVHFDALQNQSDASGPNQVGPFGSVLRVDVGCIVAHEIDARGFGISSVGHIVDMSLIGL